MGGINKASNSGGGDGRSALLQSIQKGAKLKSVVTIDKSGPLISGKVASNNGTSGSAGAGAPSRPPPPSSIGNNSNVTNGMPKLGGIFEGMSTMPKLKPVGRGEFDIPFLPLINMLISVYSVLVKLRKLISN